MASRLRLPPRSRDEARMSLLEHLDELRSRVIKIGIAFVAAAVVGWFFRLQVYNWILAPASDQLGGSLNVTDVTEAILTDFKISLYVALVATLPFILYQAWAFVVPAVGEVGRVTTYIIIVLASSLFLAGFFFGYYVVLPLALDFLLSWGQERFDLIIKPKSYLAFTTRFLFAFGVIFEIPAASYVGAKLGLINAPAMRKYRRHAILVSAIVAAMITPADPYSMIFLWLPLIILYEASVFIVAYVNPVSEELAHRDDGYEE